MTDRQRDAKATMKKVAKTAVALAVTVGVVFLMRAGAQKIAAAGDVDVTFTQPEETIVRAEKVYDLGREVPKDLELNICGMNVRVRRETLPMPSDLAERVTGERAMAAGWEPVDMPLVSAMAYTHPGETLWKRPDGSYVAQRLTPQTDGTTELAEYELPLDRLPQTVPQSASEAIQSGSAAGGTIIRARLPSYLREVVGGAIYSTQKIVRNGGTAFYVTTVSSGLAGAATAAFESRALRAGWTLEPRQSGLAVKANLSVQLTAQPFDADGTLISVYRFSDDENFIQKGKPKP